MVDRAAQIPALYNFPFETKRRPPPAAAPPLAPPRPQPFMTSRPPVVVGVVLPLALTVTAANRNDVTQLLELVDRIAAVGAHGKCRPKALLADRADDSRRHRAELRDRGITPKIATRKTEHGSGLGKDRWVIERTFSWLHNHRRLARRYDRRADIHQAFLTIGCALICDRHLKRTQPSFC
jgi:transposase